MTRVKGRNTIGGSIYQVKPGEIQIHEKSRPLMIKVAPKVSLLHRNGSEQIIDTEQLENSWEDKDIGNELIADQESIKEHRYSDQLTLTDLSDTKHISNSKEISHLELNSQPRYSGDKNDIETNTSGQKNSLWSNERPWQEQPNIALSYLER